MSQQERNNSRIAAGYVLTEGRKIRGGNFGAPTTPKPQIHIVAQQPAPTAPAAQAPAAKKN